MVPQRLRAPAPQLTIVQVTPKPGAGRFGSFATVAVNVSVPAGRSSIFTVVGTTFVTVIVDARVTVSGADDLLESAIEVA
jgi:hypothetical protein